MGFQNPKVGGGFVYFLISPSFWYEISMFLFDVIWIGVCVISMTYSVVFRYLFEPADLAKSAPLPQGNMIFEVSALRFLMALL